MRWVVAAPGPNYSVADVHVGWVEALRGLGEKVVNFNLDDRLALYGNAFKQVGENTFTRFLTSEQAYQFAVNGLYSTLYQVRPDVLMVVSGFFIPEELLDRVRRNGTRIVIAHTETPYELERQLDLAVYADLNLLDDPTGLELFQRVAPSVYVPKMYRPAIHHPGPPTPGLECDFAFVGTGFPSRVEFFEAMELDGLDVLLAGNWPSVGEHSLLYPHLVAAPDECLDNDRTADVYRSASVGLNLYRREAERPEFGQGWAMGPREVEMAACGLFFLRDPRGEGDEVLDMLPTFNSPQEASDLLRHWLGRPEERDELALKARAAVADRTFDNAAAALLRVLDT